LEVCGPQAGSIIPTTTEMSAGNAGTGHACTAAFTYDVGAVDIQKIDGYNTRA
jgi:hypothetical protein